jgi:hypothetical protein
VAHAWSDRDGRLSRCQGTGGSQGVVVGFFGLWEDYKVEPLEFREALGGTILATVRFTGRGRGSDIPVELTYFWLYVIRHRRVVSVDLYVERDEALKAAGLAE